MNGAVFTKIKIPLMPGLLLTVDLLTIDKDDAITKWSYYNPPFLEYAISQY
jgi:hypothetical protein